MMIGTIDRQRRTAEESDLTTDCRYDTDKERHL